MGKLQRTHYSTDSMALSLASDMGTAFMAPSSLAFSGTRANVKMQEVAEVVEEAPPKFSPNAFAQTLPGISGPLGFFDPIGFCSDEKDASEGKIRFYREVELKHCRVAMLAALGFPLAEQFHPLFATDDAPSFSAFQQTPLQTFWGAVVFVIAIPEIYSVFSFQSPAGNEPWSIRLDHQAGDLGFDPLGLKPTDPKELAEMQTKELNNGRLAMIAIAGMVVQEGITGGKLF